MITYKTEISNLDWEKLVDLYDETDMCIGLGRKRETEKIRRAFQNSYRFVTAWDSGKIIGAGRIISDGECYGWIHDMTVLLSYRKQSIGRTIVEKLLEGNEELLIGLTSSFEAVDFYTKLGFDQFQQSQLFFPIHLYLGHKSRYQKHGHLYNVSMF